MIKRTGAITLAVVTVTIPSITTLAFVYNWHDFFKTLLVLCDIGIIAILMEIYQNFEE